MAPGEDDGELSCKKGLRMKRLLKRQGRGGLSPLGEVVVRGGSVPMGDWEDGEGLRSVAGDKR